MATIDEVRDIAFYIIRKLNDVIINFTREEQPQPQPPRIVIDNQLPNLTIEERLERIRRSINREEQPPPTPPSPTPYPAIRDNAPKLIKDIYENLKEINDHHKPRCGTMEEFLENEIMKEKSFASFLEDKRIEYEVRKEEIIEILELWKYDNISVDEIKERLNKL